MNNTLDYIQRYINKILKLEVRKFPTKFGRAKKAYLHNQNINVILDVGANKGQFAQEILDTGYKNRVISFEPVLKTYLKLEKKAQNHKNWKTLNFALGDFDGSSEINVSALSASSSILPFVSNMIGLVPDLNYTSKEVIEIKKLDSIFNDFITQGDNVFLKIDTQGFEKKILEGAQKSLKSVKMIQLEMSLVEIYQGESSMWDMISFLEIHGFKLWCLEPGFYHPETYQLLQADGIFIKSDT